MVVPTAKVSVNLQLLLILWTRFTLSRFWFCLSETTVEKHGGKKKNTCCAAAEEEGPLSL